MDRDWGLPLLGAQFESTDFFKEQKRFLKTRSFEGLRTWKYLLLLLPVKKVGLRVSSTALHNKVCPIAYDGH